MPFGAVYASPHQALAPRVFPMILLIATVLNLPSPAGSDEVPAVSLGLKRELLRERDPSYVGCKVTEMGIFEVIPMKFKT